MASSIIEEKKALLADEEKDLKEKIRADYATLGCLVSANVICPADQKEDVDFSDLNKNEEQHTQLNELLISIKNASVRLEDIKKEVTELDSLKTCSKCGNIVGDDELFCANCGERLIKAVENADDSICPQCGKPKKSEGAFCVFCGFKFAGNEPVKIEMPKERTCVQCGERLPDDVLFCHICGTRQPE